MSFELEWEWEKAEGKCVTSFLVCGMCSVSRERSRRLWKDLVLLCVQTGLKMLEGSCGIGRKDLCVRVILCHCYLSTACQNAARSVSSHTDSLSETDAHFKKTSASLNGWHHIWLVQNAGFCVAHIEETYLKCMEVHRGHVRFFPYLEY